MSAKQDELLLRTPMAHRRGQGNIDSLISDIDSEAKQRREVEKKENAAEIVLDLTPRSLVDDFQVTNKMRRVSFKSSPTSVSALLDESSPSTPVRLGTRCIDLGFRPRNDDLRIADSYSISSPSKIPILSLED
ncbi:unnamed protein product [Cylindrotheca closterium]|uniref:Uncharacterized protein n=1 Tax=Cylindrotheca closterium TaxID=2856 RepID=A0AAD2FZ78_9STRA|nr:unnamed protein product [Cylindrotheca closterium]